MSELTTIGQILLTTNQSTYVYTLNSLTIQSKTMSVQAIDTIPDHCQDVSCELEKLDKPYNCLDLMLAQEPLIEHYCTTVTIINIGKEHQPIQHTEY